MRLHLLHRARVKKSNFFCIYLSLFPIMLRNFGHHHPPRVDHTLRPSLSLTTTPSCRYCPLFFSPPPSSLSPSFFPSPSLQSPTPPPSAITTTTTTLFSSLRCRTRSLRRRPLSLRPQPLSKNRPPRLNPHTLSSRPAPAITPPSSSSSQA